jgi:hypothetical protein
MFPTDYFSPSFFSPFYFSPTTTASAPTAPAPGYRDRDAFAAIIAALEASGEFATVVIGSPLDDRVTAGNDPWALVTPTEWEEGDDADPIVCVRRVSFTLTIVVRHEDPGERFQRLDRLTAVAQDAIDGSDLNGGCLPALTRLRRGRLDDRPRHPEQRVTLSGEFSYLITAYNGHDTEP